MVNVTGGDERPESWWSMHRVGTLAEELGVDVEELVATAAQLGLIHTDRLAVGPSTGMTIGAENRLRAALS